MNTQDILARINNIAARFGESSTELRYALEALMRDLEAQVRNEIASSKGAGSAVKAIVAMLKPMLKGRQALAYPWIDSDGRQCVCDGFTAFRLRNHLPLPERPENISPGIDLDRIMPESLDKRGWRKLPMPSAKELRGFIAVERAKYTGKRNNFAPVWDFGPNAPSVNAFFLLNAATIFPNAAELFWISLVRPLYLTCEDGDAVLLPIMVKGKEKLPPANDDERKALEAYDAWKKAQDEQDEQRRKIISQAHDDYDVWHEKERAAAEAALKAQKDADNAPDNAAKAEATERYYNAAESFAKAKIRRVHAWQIFHPDDAITPEDFESIIKFLHARDCAKSNAA